MTPYLEEEAGVLLIDARLLFFSSFMGKKRSTWESMLQQEAHSDKVIGIRGEPIRVGLWGWGTETLQPFERRILTLDQILDKFQWNVAERGCSRYPNKPPHLVIEDDLGVIIGTSHDCALSEILPRTESAGKALSK